MSNENNRTLDDYRDGDDYGAATQHFAGRFCCCGDFNCTANPCVNSDW